MSEKLTPKTIVRAPCARTRGATILSSAVTKRINRFAHGQALQYEQTLRRVVTLQLQALADRGASLSELVAELEGIPTIDPKAE